MKNRIKISLSIIIICIVTFLLLFKLKEKIEKEQLNNAYLNFLNKGIIIDNMSENALKFRNYITTNDKFDEVSIDAAINYYINLILHIKYNCDFKNERYVFGENNLAAPNCYPLNDNAFMYIKKIIDTEDEIYDEKNFKTKLVNQLETIFVHKTVYDDKGWYIKNDNVKIIELPYNVYFNFVPDIKEPKDDFRELKKIEIDKKNEKYIAYYINNRNELKKFETSLGFDDNGNVRVYSFSRIYFENFEKSTLSFGQHDYDLAREKHWEDVWKDVEAAGGFPGHTNEE